jgi:transposase
VACFGLISTESRGDGAAHPIARFFKVAGVRAAIEARGASLLYLPPYSPDLNPIEQLFAKLKALLRKTAARTVEGPLTAVGALLAAFSPAECANYFANAGYGRLS